MNISSAGTYIKTSAVQMARSPRTANLLRTAKSMAPFAAAAGVSTAAYGNIPEFKSVVDQGREILNNHPRLGEMSSSALFLGLVPDYLAQKYEGTKFNFRRWAGMAALGAVNGGIVLRGFYNAVNNAFPGQSLYSVAERVLIDQFMFSPAAIMGIFIAANYIEGKNTEQLMSNIKGTYPITIGCCWIFWGLMGCPAVNLMPPDLRVVTANVLSIAWMSFMSNLMHKSENTPTN